MNDSSTGRTLSPFSRRTVVALPFNRYVKRLSLNDQHTEVLGGPGSLLGLRRAEGRSGVPRCLITQLFVASRGFSNRRFGAGGQHGRHELTAMGMHWSWTPGGAIA